jgi:hypothetical protein
MSTRGLINIGGDDHDIHYRYKREIIIVNQVKIKKIYSLITNLDLISKQIRVKPLVLMNYFKKKLGVSINDNMISGVVTSDRLEKLLQDFIKKYVLCPKCKLPELVEKSGCNACGYILNSKLNKAKIKKGKIKIEQEIKSEDSSSDEEKDGHVDKHVDKKLSLLMKKLDLQIETLKDEKEKKEKLQKIRDLCWDCETEKEYCILLKKLEE